MREIKIAQIVWIWIMKVLDGC